MTSRASVPDLLPCPWCGGVELVYFDGTPTYHARIKCDTCNLYVPLTKDEWNRRAPASQGEPVAWYLTLGKTHALVEWGSKRPDTGNINDWLPLFDCPTRPTENAAPQPFGGESESGAIQNSGSPAAAATPAETATPRTPLADELLNHYFSFPKARIATTDQWSDFLEVIDRACSELAARDREVACRDDNVAAWGAQISALSVGIKEAEDRAAKAEREVAELKRVMARAVQYEKNVASEAKSRADKAEREVADANAIFDRFDLFTTRSNDAGKTWQPWTLLERIELACRSALDDEDAKRADKAEAALAKANERAEQFERVLSELVRLKDLHDALDADKIPSRDILDSEADYAENKPKAWVAARAALGAAK